MFFVLNWVFIPAQLIRHNLLSRLGSIGVGGGVGVGSVGLVLVEVVGHVRWCANVRLLRPPAD